jgi:hypothetical protein
MRESFQSYQCVTAKSLDLVFMVFDGVFGYDIKVDEGLPHGLSGHPREQTIP